MKNVAPRGRRQRERVGVYRERGPAGGDRRTSGICAGYESGDHTRNSENLQFDLEDEFSQAVCNITPERLDALRSAGVPDATFVDHLVGMAPIQTHKGGLFDPVDDGDLAVLLPVGEWDGLNWRLEDIVAFHLDQPGRWWCRRGAVQVLGAENIRPEPVFPLTLYDTPLSWLQADVRGVCVIDWRLDPEALVGPIEVETHSLKARLERRIQQAALARFDICVSEVRNAA